MIPSVTGEIACHARFGPAENPCGQVDPAAVEISFTVDGVPWNDFPPADPPVYQPSQPDNIELEASVSGLEARNLIYRWEAKSFSSEVDPPWLHLQSCDIVDRACAWNGTNFFWEDERVAFALIRLRASGCNGDIAQTIGPTQSATGVETFIEL